MIMIFIIAVRAQSIFLVVGRMARYALVGVYSLYLGADNLLSNRRTRLLRAGSHSRNLYARFLLSLGRALLTMSYQGVEMVRLPDSLCSVVGEESWK